MTAANAISREEYLATMAFHNEGEFLDAVVNLARMRGWLVMHQRPARTARGWATAVQGDAGFPDLVLVGHGRVLFRELKMAPGRVSMEQVAWLHGLAANGGDAAIWRPADWDAIEATLGAGGRG